ncbi:MAG TPA: hypothetical protein VGU45_01525 [Microvirga sp.]|jgi:hypothetical protein|nr:hypothetical protein [Microvirga sp.]
MKIISATEGMERVRQGLRHLVEYERRLCGRVMEAYRAIEKKTGLSEMKQRRILGRYGRVSVEFHEGLNMEAYLATVPPKESWPERVKVAVKRVRKALRIDRKAGFALVRTAKSPVSSLVET